MADVVQVEWDVTHLVRALDFYSKDYEYLQGIFGEDERHEAIRKAVDALNPDKLSIEAANIAVRKAVIDLVVGIENTLLKDGSNKLYAPKENAWM